MNECRSCNEVGVDVEERYSFGIYAGFLCVSCCSKYVDRCGLDGEQGSPAELDEDYWPEDY